MLLFFRDKGFLTIFYGCLSQSMLYGAYLIMMTFYVTDFLNGDVADIPMFLIGTALLTVIVGYYTSRYFDCVGDGQKRRLMVLLASTNLVYFVFPFVDNLWWALVLNCVFVSMGSLIFQNLLSYAKLDSVRWGKKRHLSAMTQRSSATLGFMLGCSIGGVILEFYGFATLFNFLGIIGVSMIVMSLFLPDLPTDNAQQNAQDTNLDFTSVNPSLKVTLVVLFLCHVTISTLLVNLPLHVVWLGGGADESGYAMGVATFVELFVLVGVSYLLARMASRTLLMIIAIVMTLCMLALGITETISQVYIAQILVGVGLGLLMGGGLTIVQGNDAKQVGKRTFYYQTLVKTSSLLGNLSPYLIAWGLTPAMVFQVVALFPLAGLMVLILWRLRRRLLPNSL